MVGGKLPQYRMHPDFIYAGGGYDIDRAESAWKLWTGSSSTMTDVANAMFTARNERYCGNVATHAHGQMEDSAYDAEEPVHELMTRAARAKRLHNQCDVDALVEEDAVGQGSIEERLADRRYARPKGLLDSGDPGTGGAAREAHIRGGKTAKLGLHPPTDAFLKKTRANAIYRRCVRKDPHPISLPSQNRRSTNDIVVDVRGDGRCGYRAFAIAALEYVNLPDEVSVDLLVNGADEATCGFLGDLRRLGALTFDTRLKDESPVDAIRHAIVHHSSYEEWLSRMLADDDAVPGGAELVQSQWADTLALSGLCEAFKVNGYYQILPDTATIAPRGAREYIQFAHIEDARGDVYLAWTGALGDGAPDHFKAVVPSADETLDVERLLSQFCSDNTPSLPFFTDRRADE